VDNGGRAESSRGASLRDYDLDGVTGPKRPVVVVRNNQLHRHLYIRNFNIRSYGEFRQRFISGNNRSVCQTTAPANRFCMVPDRSSGEILIGQIAEPAGTINFTKAAAYSGLVIAG